MDIVEKLKSAHSFHGNPLHREAWEEIELLQLEKEGLLNEIKVLRRGLNFWCQLAMNTDDEIKDATEQ